MNLGLEHARCDTSEASQALWIEEEALLHLELEVKKRDWSSHVQLKISNLRCSQGHFQALLQVAQASGT